MAAGSASGGATSGVGGAFRPSLRAPGNWNAFFGFMHGPAVGLAGRPGLTLASLMVAGLLYAASRATAGERLMPVSSALPAE